MADLPRRGEAGIRDVLVRDGVREAMLPALGGVSISCSLTLRSPAVPEPDRRPLEDIARRAERRILDSRTWDRYAEAAAQVGVEMEGLSERLLPRGS